MVKLIPAKEHSENYGQCAIARREPAHPHPASPHTRTPAHPHTRTPAHRSRGSTVLHTAAFRSAQQLNTAAHTEHGARREAQQRSALHAAQRTPHPR